MSAPETIGKASAPDQQNMAAESGELSPTMLRLQELMGDSSRLEVHQKLNLLEAVTQGMCEMANGYKIMKDVEGEEPVHILSAREDSQCLTRCCCAPHHSTLVKIEDAEDAKVLLTLERIGCACPCPQKCLGQCPICCDMCADNITVYEGNIEGTPGNLENAPVPVTMLKQPMCGGGIFPKLMEYPKGDDSGGSSSSPHYFQGPCIFGGCSELVMPATYRYKTQDKTEVAALVHMTPKTCYDVFLEICTDVDKFEIKYEPTATMADRATVLAGAFLVDYMFFEMDNGMISCSGGFPPKTIEFTCCFMFCCGILKPCKIKFSLGEDGSVEAEADTE